jgi:hypothetical protein
MFDQIMENSMAIWMLLSALFPIFLIVMIARAVLHLRRLRAMVDNMPEPPIATHSWVEIESEDWVPSP